MNSHNINHNIALVTRLIAFIKHNHRCFIPTLNSWILLGIASLMLAYCIPCIIGARLGSVFTANQASFGRRIEHILERSPLEMAEIWRQAALPNWPSADVIQPNIKSIDGADDAAAASTVWFDNCSVKGSWLTFVGAQHAITIITTESGIGDNAFSAAPCRDYLLKKYGRTWYDIYKIEVGWPWLAASYTWCRDGLPACSMQLVDGFQIADLNPKLAGILEATLGIPKGGEKCVPLKVVWYLLLANALVLYAILLSVLSLLKSGMCVLRYLRGRCVQCSYLLIQLSPKHSGSVAVRCPECGFARSGALKQIKCLDAP